MVLNGTKKGALGELVLVVMYSRARTCCKHARAALNSSASSITVQGERGGGADDDDDEACTWAYLMCSKAFSAPPSLSHMAIMPCVKRENIEPADKNEN